MSPLASDCQSEPVGLIVLINRTRRKLSMRQMRALDETRKFDDLKKSLPSSLFRLEALYTKGKWHGREIRSHSLHPPFFVDSHSPYLIMKNLYKRNGSLEFEYKEHKAA